MTDYRPTFRTALSAKAQPLGRRLTPEEICEVCQVVTEGIVAEARKRTPKKAQETDQEWLANLEADPALKGINVKQEIGRAQFWCRQNKRVPTRRFLVNWLGKAERVIELKSAGAQYATGLKLPPPKGPDGWEEWLASNMPPDDHPAYSQLTASLINKSWSMMPKSWQSLYPNQQHA